MCIRGAIHPNKVIRIIDITENSTMGPGFEGTAASQVTSVSAELRDQRARRLENFLWVADKVFIGNI